MSQLIKDIFLPEKIKSYYLFSKTIVGIEINKTNIIATKTRIQGTTSTIELIIEEKISEEISEEDFARTSPTLTSIFSKIGSYDEIHTTLPSSIVVFKELKLPFNSREKIGMVIGFEIEPLLPFSLREAAIDFIITREIPEEKSSEILVTAVQKQQIIQHLAIFEAVGLKPDVITIDMISLYGLYRQIDAYKQLQGGTVLINITAYSTAITLIINGQLKTVRTLPKGIIALTKQIALELNKTPQEIIDHLLRFGLETTANPEYSPVIEKAVADWWDSINFTLTSFSTQLLNRQPMTKIIFLGNGSLIKGLIPFIGQKSGISCELFNIEGIDKDASYTIKNSNLITPLNVISASTTLPLATTVDYNLAQKEFKTSNNSLLLKQLIVLIVLTISLFAILITHYSLQIKKFTAEIHASNNEALTALTSTFKTLEGEKVLSEAIEEAEKEVEEQRKRWFAFSNQSRASFLQHLLELSSKIDKKSIDLNLEQLTIDKDTLTLKAEVRDHDAVKVLARELGQSKLFGPFESPETPQFTMKIPLATSKEENS
ncbi:MAG TPA: pilus assembly protein PilM [Candidatus Babeliales bacterium]|jgi:Tfp pilus assembly PilM family ATPase|nr:pilus assembly protein PilM [Candidatus Babeliales bacterium]